MPTFWKGISPARSATPAASAISSAKKEEPGAILEQIKGDKFAADTFERMKEHFAKNEVDPGKDKLTLGPVLKMDGRSERFLDNDAANDMLKDKYREPYVVPEIS